MFTTAVPAKLLGLFVKPVSRRFATMSDRNFKAALIQLKVGTDRDKNLENACNLIKEAADNKSKLVVLPECFNSPYGTKFFAKYAECVPDGQSCEMLSKAAKDNKVYLIGGSIPEKGCDEKYFNTSTVWNPNGELIATFRKMHLFDIDIPGGITFKESDILHGGDKLATFNIGNTKIGLGICYDIRFEEIAKIYRLQGCEILVYPGAFNMTTGPMHWELLQRGRAIDNQVFVMACSPARNELGYVAWGHSQITNPWGKIIAQAGHEQEIIYSDIDLTECENMRQQIPIGSQRRIDIYETNLVKK